MKESIEPKIGNLILTMKDRLSVLKRQKNDMEIDFIAKIEYTEEYIYILEDILKWSQLR